MKDLGIQKSVLTEINTKQLKFGNFRSLGEIFKNYFDKYNVPFLDTCCLDNLSGYYPVRRNGNSNYYEYFDGTSWQPVPAEVTIDPSASTASISKYLLSESSDVFTINGPKVRDINSKRPFVIYKMPDGNLTNGYDDFILNNEMSSATITTVNGYDNIVVSGSTTSSYVRFNFQNTLNRFAYKLKFRVEALGVTGPILGLRCVAPSTSYYNFVYPDMLAYVNLLTGAVTEFAGAGGSQTLYNGWTGAAVPGDIIEIIYELFNNGKNNSLTVYKSNKETCEVSTAKGIANILQTTVFGHYPGLTMADGTYTLLDFSITTDDYKPKLLITGDSMGAGAVQQNIWNTFESLTPYRAFSTAVFSQRFAGMKSSVWSILKLRPEYVVMFNFLDPMRYEFADPANINYATWTADYIRYVNILKNMGAKIIFVLPEKWTAGIPVIMCTHFANFINANFPSDIKIPLLISEIALTDGTHYDANTNLILTNKIIAAIEADGGL